MTPACIRSLHILPCVSHGWNFGTRLDPDQEAQTLPRFEGDVQPFGGVHTRLRPRASQLPLLQVLGDDEDQPQYGASGEQGGVGAVP